MTRTVLHRGRHVLYTQVRGFRCTGAPLSLLFLFYTIIWRSQ